MVILLWSTLLIQERAAWLPRCRRWPWHAPTHYGRELIVVRPRGAYCSTDVRVDWLGQRRSGLAFVSSAVWRHWLGRAAELSENACPKCRQQYTQPSLSVIWDLTIYIRVSTVQSSSNSLTFPWLFQVLTSNRDITIYETTRGTGSLYR